MPEKNVIDRHAGEDGRNVSTLALKTSRLALVVRDVFVRIKGKKVEREVAARVRVDECHSKNLGIELDRRLRVFHP